MPYRVRTDTGPLVFDRIDGDSHEGTFRPGETLPDWAVERYSHPAVVEWFDEGTTE